MFSEFVLTCTVQKLCSFYTILWVVSIVQNVIVGSDMPLEGLEKSHLLGKGGNGRVYRYPLLNKDYAVKFVSVHMHCIDVYTCVQAHLNRCLFDNVVNKQYL